MNLRDQTWHNPNFLPISPRSCLIVVKNHGPTLTRLTLGAGAGAYAGACAAAAATANATASGDGATAANATGGASAAATAAAPVAYSLYSEDPTVRLLRTLPPHHHGDGNYSHAQQPTGTITNMQSCNPSALTRTQGTVAART